MSLLAASAAAEPRTRIKLAQDFLSATVADYKGERRLAIFTGASSSQNWSAANAPKSVEWFRPENNSLKALGLEPLPEDATGFDVCPTGSAGAQQQVLLLLRPAGIWRLDTRTYIAEGATLFAHSRPDMIPHVNLCFSGTGGQTILLMPTLRGVMTWDMASNGTITATGEVPVRARQTQISRFMRDVGPGAVQRVHTSIEFPETVVADLDGDQRADLCFTSQDRITCHRPLPTGKGFTLAPVLDQEFSVLSAEERGRPTVRVRSRLIDFNGDGRLDLSLQKADLSFADMSGSVGIYLQRADGKFPNAPDQLLKRSGFFGYHEYLDLDGDGMIDQISPVASVGIASIISALTTRSIDVQFMFFKNRTGTLAEAKSLFDLTYKIKFGDFSWFNGKLPLWRVTADASHAAPQVIVPDRSKGIRVFALGKDATLSSEPIQTHDVSLGSYLEALDLRGDGVNDIIVGYGEDPKLKKELVFIPGRRTQ